MTLSKDQRNNLLKQLNEILDHLSRKDFIEEEKKQFEIWRDVFLSMDEHKETEVLESIASGWYLNPKILDVITLANDKKYYEICSRLQKFGKSYIK